ncbi:MAG: AMIN domain-containing protein [Thermodesulfobacteriota bacterium]|nr:AMIN domain-containing protein [Thermodesulfobacteriota bacterium]
MSQRTFHHLLIKTQDAKQALFLYKHGALNILTSRPEHLETRLAGPWRKTLKCGHCGKDLMLAIEPRGLAKLVRLWPFSSYRCVRCGKRTIGLAPAYQTTGSRVFLVLLILGAMGAAIWFAGLEKRGQGLVPNATAKQGLQKYNSVVRERTIPAPEPLADKSLNKDSRALGLGEGPLEEVVLAPEGEKASPATDETLSALQETLKKAYVKSTGPKTPNKARIKVVEKKAPKPAPNKARPAKAGSGQIKAIETLATETELVISLVADKPLRTYTAFPLKAPPRFVIDVPGSWEYPGDTEILVAKFGVQKMRVGVHQDKMRIVLDLDAQKPKDPVIKPSPQGLFLVVE